MSQRNAVHVTDVCPRDACHPIHPKPQKLETLFWSGNKKGARHQLPEDAKRILVWLAILKR